MLSSICSLVRNAAKLAVYDEVTMSAKNHQAAAAKRGGAPLRVIVGELSAICRKMAKKMFVVIQGK